jgi:salicylate hydroxylase
VIAQALEHSRSKGGDVAQALRMYDDVRAPHYRDLVSLFSVSPVKVMAKLRTLQYAILSSFEQNAKDLTSISPPLEENEFINERTRRNWAASNRWIYEYNVSSTSLDNRDSCKLFSQVADVWDHYASA